VEVPPAFVFSNRDDPRPLMPPQLRRPVGLHINSV